MSRTARAKQPFLLSLHYTAPHWPWETRDGGELAKSFGKGRPIYHLDGGNIHAYRRMIHHMDEGIGRVLGALDDGGIARDTIVVFTSDNGGERFSDNWPLVGGKMDLMEGGIRVPYVVRWPARTPAGTGLRANRPSPWTGYRPSWRPRAPLQHPDYPSDGLSLVKQLGDPDAVTERPLFWRMKHNEQRAMFAGRWKYLKVNEHEYLFDVMSDERERANLPSAIPSGCPDARGLGGWDATMPPIPAEAGVRLVYGKKDMP